MGVLACAAPALSQRGKRTAVIVPSGTCHARALPGLCLLDTAGWRRALYHCNYCQKDISNTVRIKCAVCADFDLCLECFSVGAEVTPHRSDHAYRVVDCLSFPLYHPDWGVRPARPARPWQAGPLAGWALSACSLAAPAVSQHLRACGSALGAR